MHYLFRTLLTRLAGLLPSWEWEHLSGHRFSIGLGMCVLGGLATGWAADKNPILLVLALALLTAGVAIASTRFVP
jgi:hypothetical protein